jgi:hypothetical protein
MMQPVLVAVRRVRRRMRWQAGLDGAARAAVLGSAAAAVAIYLYKLDAFSSSTLRGLLVAIVLAVVAAAMWRAVQKIPLERAAKRIDASHRLHDRLGSALAFSGEREPTPFMRAALDDAARAAGTVDARRASPFHRPPALGPALVLSTAAMLIALLRFPSSVTPAAPVVDAVPRLVVDPEALAPEREAVAQLAAETADDPEAKKLADRMNELLTAVDKQELTRKEAFDQLAAIEKQMKADDGSFDELKRQLKKAGEQLSKEKLTREAGQALEKEDLKKAKEELQKLATEAEKLAQEKKDDPKREELAKALEKAAAEQQKSPEEKKLDAEEQRLKEEQRRLKREQEQNPNDEETARRLKRNQRELERLERERQKMAEQRRELQRLQRELQKAAEQLRQKLSPEAAEALRRAAQQMGDMEQEIKKLGNGKKMQMQIAELKEVLRRAGSSGRAQNGQPQDGNGPQRGRNNSGKGQSLMRDFSDRAGGQKTLLLGQNPGDQKGPTVLLPLPMGPGGDKPGPSGEKGQGMPGEPGGDGIGNEHDPHVMGDPTKMNAKHQATRVEGQEGAGPNRSETILGSAEKGFSGRAYKRVYSDYSSVVEEVMSKERVPPGYRYYVKRYFQLIKPRE